MAIYLDHNATSPMHPEVVEAILPFLRQPPGNPSSLHSFGRMARSAIESARAEVAELLNCPPGWIVFTSGGSEANNLFLKGFIDVDSPRAVVGTPIEHPSVIEPLRQLEAQGHRVLWLPVDGDGRVDLDAAATLLSSGDPQLMTVQLANNETGVLQPVDELATMIDRERCLLHSDATQVIGKLPLDLAGSDYDAISFSAHKMMGPQGVGALVTRQKPRSALIAGGDQEKQRRAGTENVAMIVGLGKAAQLARLEMGTRERHMRELRDAFEAGLADIPGSVVFGANAARLPNTTYFAVPYYHGETLLMELDRAGFALSSGSACHSEVTSPSHVLKAMGVADGLALNAVRVSFGMDNSLDDVGQLLARLNELINRLPAVMRQAAG